MNQSTQPEATVKNTHRFFELKPNIVSYSSDKGGLLHNAIARLKSPQIVAYVLCRGRNVTIEGIDCSALSPMDLSLTNSTGETALKLAETELLKSSTYTDIDDIVAIKLINNFIDLAKTENFEEIAYKMEHYEATYNTEKNVILAQSRETDIAKDPTDPKLRFREGQRITDVRKNTMPHYPSFDKEWKDQDTQNTRRVFISAYRDDNFPLMERAIMNHKIKFKGSDTVSELAYKAIDQNCLHMASNLLKQGSASLDYTPEGETQTLKDKYNLKKAQIAADGQVKTGLKISLKRAVTIGNLQNSEPDNRPPKKSKDANTRS